MNPNRPTMSPVLWVSPVMSLVRLSSASAKRPLFRWSKPSAVKKLDVHSEDFADAIGELCNMFAGNAKKDFGLTAGIGIPNVIVGSGHSVSRMSDVPCVVIPCSCEFGGFAVEVNIKQVS